MMKTTNSNKKKKEEKKKNKKDCNKNWMKRNILKNRKN